MGVAPTLLNRSCVSAKTPKTLFGRIPTIQFVTTKAFVVTNWIVDILPNSVFGVLALTQERFNNVGATPTRTAYIHFIVPQLIMVMIYLLWKLLNCRRYWRLYPGCKAYLRRVYAYFDERKKVLSLIAMVALLALTIWPELSPDFLLTVMEYVKKPRVF